MRHYPTASGTSRPAGELTFPELAALPLPLRDDALAELGFRLVMRPNGRLGIVGLRLGRRTA